MPAESVGSTDLASEILGLLGHDPHEAAGTELTPETFLRCTREQLLELARRLGLSGVTKLSKDLLAGRVQTAYADLARDGGGGRNGGPKGAPAAAGTTETEISFHKFDLGRVAAEQPLPQNIPWGYGHDRVTAMPVDPERLFAYWEVTDAAMEVARRALGPGGAAAWLNLRVYDITGRLFDGTNAHSYFDHKIERHDRQWFFDINKPTSTACVEVGLRSAEGYFVKIARSGRVEFPRRGPSAEGLPEWLTVRTASGWAGEPVQGGAPGTAGSAGGALGGAGSDGWQGWSEGAGFPLPGGHRVFERRWDWQEGGGEQWQSELARVEWVGPLQRSEWEAGPFTYAVEPPPLIEQRDVGEVTVRTENGRVHVVYGPWQVVIRGIGARAERRVLATWEYKRTVALTGGAARVAAATGRLHAGASEWVALGASERVWLGASEILLGGASELFMMGASELRMRGASETMYAGASEYRMRGASERLMRGASEWSYRGASERLVAGASERLYAGASEQRLGGASEGSYPSIGASENAPRSGQSDKPAGYPETR